jgi:hypothetical protein
MGYLQLMLVIMSFMIGLFLLFGCIPEDKATAEFDEMLVQICEQGGGKASFFNSLCADSCEYHTGKMDVCGRMRVQGCDCGKGSCWDMDKNKCILIPS